VVSLLLLGVVQAQKKPEVTVSPARVKSGDSLLQSGTGFTPNKALISHLLRPDGTEYNLLRLRADEKGEFVRKIETAMLDLGTFETWAEDEASKAVSNRARFTVESSYTRPEK
jgi:hypothetical protein